MTTTGRLVTINDDAHHHEPNEAPAKHTKPTSVAITAELLHGGIAVCVLEGVLKWIPMNAGQEVRENDLPERVLRIEIGNDIGWVDVPVHMMKDTKPERLILHLGIPDEGPLSLQSLEVNGCTWPTSVHMPLLAPPGHELVIRKVGYEIVVFRRRYADVSAA